MNIPRIWIGYARPELDRSFFYKQLGGVFMPATVQVMGQLGLQCYIPTVLPETDGLPDEVALVFYPSPDIYKNAAGQSCAGRMYGALHQSLFQFPNSKSRFPENYSDDRLIENKSFFVIFDRRPNWQNGQVLTEVWRNEALTAAEFQTCVSIFVKQVSARRDELDGVYLYVEKPFMVCWACGSQTPDSLIARLPGEIIARVPAKPAVTAALFERDSGLQITENQSINFQFTPTVS